MVTKLRTGDLAGAASVPFHVVACCYSCDPTTFLEKVRTVFSRLGHSASGVVVDNRGGSPESRDPLWDILPGDNADLDFSAYFQGLDFLKAKHGQELGVVIFINDSLFLRHNPLANLQRIVGLTSLLAEMKAPAITGKADSYQTICLRNPWSGLNSYVSTYCFALNNGAQSILGRLRALAEADGLYDTSGNFSTNWGSPLNPAFRELLLANIHYSASPYRWHSISKHQNNAPLLQKKVRCIYYEHRLSGEIGLNGCIVPINAGPRARISVYVAEFIARVKARFFG